MLAGVGHYRLISMLVNVLQIEHKPYAQELLDALAPDRTAAGPIRMLMAPQPGGQRNEAGISLARARGSCTARSPRSLGKEREGSV
jgi:hypothetical protein